MKMNYAVVGSNDLGTAINFYNALFENTGFSHVFTSERMAFWQCNEFTFAVAEPFDGAAATNGNGTMIGFDAGTTKDVRELYAKAIALGGTSEGEPNQRAPYFSCYVRDLDKNKLCFYN